IQVLEAPNFIGVRDLVHIAGLKPSVKSNDTLEEARRENADATEVQEMETFGVFGERVVSQMRIAVDDAVMRHRSPPGFNQQFGDAIARFLYLLQPVHQPAALKPRHRQQTLGRKLFERLWRSDPSLGRQHQRK